VIEELGKRAEALTAEKQSVGSALAQYSGESQSASSELAGLESTLDRTMDEIASITKEIDAIKRRLDGTDIPALTEALEKKKKEFEEVDRRLRNKESDIADAQRERAHFAKRIEELNADRERVAEKNTRIDQEIAGAEQQIASGKETIRALDERQKQFSGELEELRKKRADVVTQIQASEQKLLQFEAAMERVKVQIAAMQEREQAILAELELLRQQVGDVETTLSLAEIEEGLAEADRAIRRIGAVNMLASRNTRRSMPRPASGRRRRKSFPERTTLLERIEKYEQMKYESFMNAFKALTATSGNFCRLTEGSVTLSWKTRRIPSKAALRLRCSPGTRPSTCSPPCPAARSRSRPLPSSSRSRSISRPPSTHLTRSTCPLTDRMSIGSRQWSRSWRRPRSLLSSRCESR
jgi:chromosome segregation protein